MWMNDIPSLLQTFNEWSNFDLRIKFNKFLLAFPVSLNMIYSLIYSLQATPNFYPCLQHTKRLLGTCSHTYNRLPFLNALLYNIYLLFTLDIWNIAFQKPSRPLYPESKSGPGTPPVIPKHPLAPRSLCCPLTGLCTVLLRKGVSARHSLPQQSARHLAGYCGTSDWLLHGSRLQSTRATCSLHSCQRKYFIQLFHNIHWVFSVDQVWWYDDAFYQYSIGIQ